LQENKDQSSQLLGSRIQDVHIQRGQITLFYITFSATQKWVLVTEDSQLQALSRSWSSHWCINLWSVLSRTGTAAAILSDPWQQRYKLWAVSFKKKS